MKIFYHLLFLLFAINVNGKEVYIGSTPANNIVKTFLGIPLSDSVDFIRWKLFTGNDQYSLHCEYGIGKNGTNGFIDPKMIDIKGALSKENNYYRLQHNNKTISLAKLNDHLLHFTNTNKDLIPGTGGWAYTLYSSGTPQPIALTVKKILLKDSMIFHGRTPCSEFPKQGLTVSPNCYKLKWSIVLYSKNGVPTVYKTRGTAFRDSEPKTGKWYYKNGMAWLDGGDQRLYFIIPEDNIMVFTDAKWNLLQGDEDFGYTLSRK